MADLSPSPLKKAQFYKKNNNKRTMKQYKEHKIIENSEKKNPNEKKVNCIKYIYKQLKNI